MSKFRVPTLSNPNIVIKLTEDRSEIETANQLVFKNYVAANYWDANPKYLANEFLHSPARKVVVALHHGEVIGTISLILDSSIGLPSEGAQKSLVGRIREKGGVLAEVSGFATSRSHQVPRSLALFLISYVLQYAYYYAGADHLIASSISAHANFYECAVGFSRIISGPTLYNDVRLSPYFYLLSLSFSKVHSMPATTPFGRFLFLDPQSCHHFPPESQMKRLRQTDSYEWGCAWVA